MSRRPKPTPSTVARKAAERLRSFDPRGSRCPICSHAFRGCPHTREQAIARLDADLIRARIAEVAP